jgi:hypothetical protein
MAIARESCLNNYEVKMPEVKTKPEMGLIFRTFIVYQLVNSVIGSVIRIATSVRSISSGQTFEEAQRIYFLPSNIILLVITNMMLLLFIGYYLGYKVQSRPIYHCVIFGVIAAIVQSFAFFLRSSPLLLVAVIVFFGNFVIMLPAVIGGGYWAGREIRNRTIVTKKAEEAETETEDDDFEIEEINGKFMLSYKEREKIE